MSFKLAGLHPVVRQQAELALEVARDFNIPVQITSGFRSWSEQKKLRRNFEECVAKGKFPWAEGCKYPANRPGESSHNFGLAFDSWAPAGPEREAWIFIRQLAGFNVPANDHVHAEVPDWRPLVVGITPR